VVNRVETGVEPLDRELERHRAKRLGQPLKHLELVPLDVDLAEVRDAVTFEHIEVVTCTGCFSSQWNSEKRPLSCTWATHVGERLESVW